MVKKITAGGTNPEMTFLTPEIGERIIRARERKRLTRLELAALLTKEIKARPSLGIPSFYAPSLKTYEAGYGQIQTALLMLIAELLDRDLEFLLTGVDAHETASRREEEAAQLLADFDAIHNHETRQVIIKRVREFRAKEEHARDKKKK